MRYTYLLLVFVLIFSSCKKEPTTSLSLDELYNKIKGGWAGQTIGCTYGSWTEFRYKGTIIHDYQPMVWYDDMMLWWYDNFGGLYDDIYMDLTFVDVFERVGLDAPADSFAMAIANAEYPLWHANQQARRNVLDGIMPPESGHWLNNPHADDIDFQIEADFAGLMSPGMPHITADICDRTGHIMNSGDGYYGGLYVATMYSLAFIYDDIDFIVREALKVVPQESGFYKTIRDVISWYDQYPDDWYQVWYRTLRHHGEDIGCPDGVFSGYNIDAKVNAAWIVTGLLYGKGDFEKTMEISTRCGDDSDCNPANAVGILATMTGYDKIPEKYRTELAVVDTIPFPYMEFSLADTYEISYKHALELIKQNGGIITDSVVTLPYQKPETAPLEINFENHYPVEKVFIRRNTVDSFILEDTLSLTFNGNGIVMRGYAQAPLDENGEPGEYTYNLLFTIDGTIQDTVALPTNFLTRKETAYFKYQLPDTLHTLNITVLNPLPHNQTKIHIPDPIVYAKKERNN